MSEAELKKPTGVYILALLFILAPLGNLTLSFANSGNPNWHHPSVFGSYLSAVSLLDWLWLGAVALTGILLLRPHKTTWSLAIVSLTIVFGVNSYRFFTNDFATDGHGLQWHLVFSTIVTICMLLMLFYFRFPYLDRRTGWPLSTENRYNLRTRADIVAQDIYEGVTESLSLSGARIRLKRNMEGASAKLQYVDVILPEIRNVKIKARVIEYRDNVLRLKFKDLRGRNRSHILDWFKSQSETE